MEFLSGWSLWNQALFWVYVPGLIFSLAVLPLSEFLVSSAPDRKHNLDITFAMFIITVIWPIGWPLMVVNEERKMAHAAHIIGIILGISSSRVYFSGRGLTCNS